MVRRVSTDSAGWGSVTIHGRPSGAWPHSWMVSTLGWAPSRWAVAAAASKPSRVRPSDSGGKTVTVTGRPTRSL